MRCISVPQRQHLAREIAHFKLADVGGAVAKLRLGLHAHLVGSAELIEVVHKRRTQIGLQGRRVLQARTTSHQGTNEQLARSRWHWAQLKFCCCAESARTAMRLSADANRIPSADFFRLVASAIPSGCTLKSGLRVATRRLSVCGRPPTAVPTTRSSHKARQCLITLVETDSPTPNSGASSIVFSG